MAFKCFVVHVAFYCPYQLQGTYQGFGTGDLQVDYQNAVLLSRWLIQKPFYWLVVLEERCPPPRSVVAVIAVGEEPYSVIKKKASKIKKATVR